MMKCPQDPILAIGVAHQGKAHERRLAEVEITDPVAVEKCLIPRIALGFTKRPPIEAFYWNLGFVEHLLHGLRHTFPAETAAQDRMSVNHLLPSTEKVRFDQRLAYAGHDLLDVHARIWATQPVIEHSR